MTIKVVRYQQHVRPIPPKTVVAPPDGFEATFPDFLARAGRLVPAELPSTEALRPIALNVGGWSDQFYALQKPNKIGTGEQFFEDLGPPEPIALNVPGWEPWFALPAKANKITAAEQLPEDLAPPEPAPFIALAWVDTPTIRQVLRAAQPLIDLPLLAPTFLPLDLAATPIVLRRAVAGQTDLASSRPTTVLAWSEAAPTIRRVLVAPTPIPEFAVQQVPTVFVPSAWGDLWQPARKPMPSALQRFDDPVLAAYSANVIVYPDGWQVVGFDPTRRARAQRQDKVETIVSAASISGWDSVAAPIRIEGPLRHRATDDAPSGGVTSPPPVVDYGFPAPVLARVRVAVPPDLPLTLPMLNAWPGDFAAPVRERLVVAPEPVDPGSPTTFVQMGWGTQFPDGARRPAKQPLDLASLQIAVAATPTPVWDFGSVPTKRTRAPAGAAASDPVRVVVAAPGNTDLWSFASYHIRTIRGIPEFDFIGRVRIGFAIVSTPTLLGTKQGPTMYGTEAQALLSGVDAQATLNGAKATPTLTGTKSTPTLEGDV